MEDYTINVTQIEELQMLNDQNSLEMIFSRAKSAIVNGACVWLVRKGFASGAAAFDKLDTLEDLEAFRQKVFKYLK